MTARVQRITPFLWFDGNAEEAATFYVSVFDNARLTRVARYGKEGAQASGQGEGAVMTVAFELDGQSFVALNGGPVFQFNPAVSFVVNCATQDEIDYYWGRLSDGGDASAQQCGWLRIASVCRGRSCPCSCRSCWRATIRRRRRARCRR